MVSREFEGTYFDQLRPQAVSFLDLKGAFWFFSHKGSLVHDEMSTKKDRLGSKQFFVDPRFSRLDNVLVCMPSRPIWDEYHQSPGRFYFKLNRKLILE